MSREHRSTCLTGVLALQGGFDAHLKILRALDSEAREVRVPADLEGLDALIIPGGESTTMALGIERENLAGPLRDFCASGRPVLGTCAGLIILSRSHLGAIDIVAKRNAFGRQLHSFESDLDIDGVDGEPVHAVFIRAPWISEVGDGVDVLAEVNGHAVAARAGAITVVAFHPELSGETRLHEQLLAASVTPGQ
jgi:5'-phosphate synthase pdxT subunit